MSDKQPAKDAGTVMVCIVRSKFLFVQDPIPYTYSV